MDIRQFAVIVWLSCGRTICPMWFIGSSSPLDHVYVMEIETMKHYQAL